MKHSWERFFAVILAVAMTLSLLPATALAAPGDSGDPGTVFDVTDYGADPTGAESSSASVNDALAAAKTLDKDVKKTISFPQGEYHFYADQSEVRKLYVSNTIGTRQNYVNKHLGILLEDLENVTVDGNGSQFIFHGDMTSFAAIRSKNVVFKNFAVDYASPSVIDVTVVSVDRSSTSATIYVPPAYTYEINGSTIHWTVEGSPIHSGNNSLEYSTWGQAFDMLSGIATRNVGNYPFNNVSAIEQVDDSLLRVTYTNANSLPKLGFCYQMRNGTKARTTPGVFFWESENITMQGMDIQFLHGFGVVAQLCMDVTVDGVDFGARPGTGRTTAGFADFLQMSSVGGTVTITNCDFSNPHDDPINIHGTFLKVTNISADRQTVTVKYMEDETAGFPQYYVGDEVDFSTLGTIIPVEDSLRTVTTVQNPAEDATGDDALRTIVVTLDRPIPEEITANNYVMENVTYIPEVLIKGCRFVETPTRGILVTTRKPVVIEDNYFDRMGMAAIFISCDAQLWWESGRTENVTIRNNKFIILNRSTGNPRNNAGIYVCPTNPNNDPNYQIHKNLLFEGNTVYMVDQREDVLGKPNTYALYAKSVNTLTVKDNTFLRFDPKVSLTLSAPGNTVAVGGALSTTLAKEGYQRNERLFHLQACKNVKFENNTYDDGLNRGVGLESITTADDVTVIGDDLNVGGDRQAPAVGGVSYYSSNPSVAAVDAGGVVTGVSAGTADITAYRTVAGRTFESEPLHVTVTAGSAAAKPEKIEIGGDSMVDVGGTANLTASVDNVVWAVHPFTTGAAAAIDQNGALTATAPGVVEVTASQGGVTASRLVTVKKAAGGLGDAWTVDREVANTWSLDVENDTATITAQRGGDWGGNDSGGSNFFLMDPPEGDFEITVKLHNKTCGQRCWCEAGLAAFTDHDNYVSVVRKNNFTNGQAVNKLAVNNESGGTPGETTKDDVSGAVYLKLTKSGDSYTGAYSEDGTTWTEIGTVTNALRNYKIGFFATNREDAAASAAESHRYTFSDFTLDGNAVSLIDTNTPPTASGVNVTSGDGTLTADYTYTDSDDEDGTLFAWYAADSDGHYTRVEGANTATLTVTAATRHKWIKAVVIPRDATGRYGAPVTSDAVEAPEQTVAATDATLSSLSVEGFTLTPAFDPEVQNYTVNVPSGVSQVLLNMAATQQNAILSVSQPGNPVALTGATTTSSVLVTAPDEFTTKLYTITINRAQGSDATLHALSATAGSQSIHFAPATRSYMLMAEKSAQTLDFTLTPGAGAAVAVRYNNEELGDYDSPKSLPLAAGLNHLELRVTAGDGISTALYRVVVVKPADATLHELTVNGTAVDIPEDGSKDLGIAQTGDDGHATLNATVDDRATIHISVDGTAVENGGTVTVAKTAVVTIRVVAEDGVTEREYRLLLSKPDPDNADLYSLDIAGLTLSPAFDPDTTAYTAATEFSQTTVSIRAVQADATVTYETMSAYQTETATLSGDCMFFRDVEDNRITVTVTSPSGKVTKTYTIDVDYTPTLYLSDMSWTSHTSGWSGWPQPGRDIGVSNNPLSLRGANGVKTFQKGLGTHANSTTVFDLSGLGATRFTAKVGPNQSSGGSPHISFEVKDGNDTQLWSSNGEITHSDEYRTIDIDVTGVTQLKLLDEQSGGNGSAHATWAEAKLTGGNIGPALSNNVIPISYIDLGVDALTLYVNAGDGHTATLTPTVKPDGAAHGAAEERTLEWSSDDEEIATVNDGVVTAVSAGEATITATAPSGVTATCKVTVKREIEGQVALDADGDGVVRLGSVLTANVNDIAQEFKDAGLHYVWSVSDTAEGEGTVIADANTDRYTIPDNDPTLVGKFITVTVTPEGDYHIGESKAVTAAVRRMEGPALQAVPTFEDVSAEGAEDGAITGLFKGRAYQYKQVANATDPVDETGWTDFTPEGDDSGVTGNFGTARIEGLGVGTYIIRRAADALHEAGPHRTVTIDVRDAVNVHIHNPQTFDGGRVTMGRSQIPRGDTARLTVTPDTGYELTPGSLKATANTGEEVEAEATATEGLYTFTVPGGVDVTDVTISARFRLKTYTVTHAGLDHILCAEAGEHTHTAPHGRVLEIVLKPEEGYEMPRSITMTNRDTNAPFTDFTYLPSTENSAWRVVTFRNGVTCNVDISGTGVPKTYTAVYHLTNGLRAPNASQTAAHGQEFAVTLEAAGGYKLPRTVTVTVNDGALPADAYSYDPQSGKITVPGVRVTGNLVITADGVAETVPLQSVTLVGPSLVGRVLTVNTVPVLATVEYRWILVDEDGTETAIAGETGKTYTIPAEALGKTIKVKVTATGSYTGTLTSTPTAEILTSNATFVYVDSVTIPETARVQVGRTATLAAIVTPEDATNPTLFWSSDNEAIATVDQNGVVTGVAEGTATITAASTDRVENVSASCAVTVTKAATPSRPSGSNNGSTTTKTETREDGTKVTTVTEPDGTVTETVAQPDGTTSETVTTKDGDVTITVTDENGEELVKAEIPAAIPEPETKFEDVDTTPWAEEAIHKVAGLELVNGTGGNKYSPVAPMTRGSLATVLHRLSQGKTDYEVTFKDVAQGKYYTEGVAWAAKANVVKGISEDVFAPDQTITREQLAVMLARYAKLVGLNTKADAKALESFTDGEKTGAWAVDGVAWCVENGILKGKGQNDLDPTADVTRAEVAVMLDRFIALLK